jgi:cell pole-organizing protein PopZ
MMVSEAPPTEPHAASEPEPPSPPAHEPTHLMISGDEFPAPVPQQPAAPHPQQAEALPETETLVAPEAAAMAASSVGVLMRTLAAERTAVVHRGGPSIEDVVREEIRPLLKEWLDTHLPPLVERLVRAEIERVVGRIGS